MRHSPIRRGCPRAQFTTTADRQDQMRPTLPAHAAAARRGPSSRWASKGRYSVPAATAMRAGRRLAPVKRRRTSRWSPQTSWSALRRKRARLASAPRAPAPRSRSRSHPRTRPRTRPSLRGRGRAAGAKVEKSACDGALLLCLRGSASEGGRKRRNEPGWRGSDLGVNSTGHPLGTSGGPAVMGTFTMGVGNLSQGRSH